MSMIQYYNLTNCNPSMYDVYSIIIHTLTSVHMTTSYNRTTNRFNFIRTYGQTTSYNNMYINIIIAVTLGLLINVEFLINFCAIECLYSINVIAVKSLRIHRK